MKVRTKLAQRPFAKEKEDKWAFRHGEETPLSLLAMARDGGKKALHAQMVLEGITEGEKADLLSSIVPYIWMPNTIRVFKGWFFFQEFITHYNFWEASRCGVLQPKRWSLPVRTVSAKYVKHLLYFPTERKSLSQEKFFWCQVKLLIDRPFQLFGSAGFVHFLENSGDPWHNYENSHSPYLSYGTCLYFLFVTISTVGRVVPCSICSPSSIYNIHDMLQS